jgi:DNA repair exonuclease SbcCD ATPase subunit
MTYSTLPELRAQYDGLSRRIEALDQDIGLETDGEKRMALQFRRASLADEREHIASALHRGESSMSNGGSAADYRLTNTERMLQTADGKLERMADIINDIKADQSLIKHEQSLIRRDLDALRDEVQALRNGVAFPRVYVMASGVAMALFFLLLVIITWRVMS